MNEVIDFGRYVFVVDSMQEVKLIELGLVIDRSDQVQTIADSFYPED